MSGKYDFYVPLCTIKDSCEDLEEVLKETERDGSWAHYVNARTMAISRIGREEEADKDIINSCAIPIMQRASQELRKSGYEKMANNVDWRIQCCRREIQGELLPPLPRDATKKEREMYKEVERAGDMHRRLTEMLS